jgi:tripartite ATP-independent transporter DctP family solute receptor
MLGTCRRRRRLAAFVCWIAAAIAGLSGCARVREVSVIQLGHGLDVQHPVHQAMVRMGERLDELSSGRLRLEIYPSEQLGSERECLELLQIGSLGMTKVSTSVLETFAPTFRLLGLPYLFRDRAHRDAVLDGDVGRRLLLAAEPQRLRGLAFYDAGSRSFYTRKRAIRRPEDLRGLKIRTQESPSAMAMVKALGGSPTPLAWGELYTALQQGVVDGAENNPPSYHLSRHFEVAPFLSLDEHTSVPDVLLISTSVWQRLSAEQRGWLQQAADDSARFQREAWRAAEAEALAAVRAAGVEVVEPDKAAFAALAAPLRDGLRADPELALLLTEIER